MIKINPNTTAKIIFPKNGKSLPDEEKRQETLRTLHGITHDQIEAIGQALSEQEQRSTEQKKAEQKKTEQIKELYGDKEKILENLKKNCVKVEENVEMMGYKGKNVHINLPAVGNFEGFKFDYFVSDKAIYQYDFEENSELEMESYSMKEVGELLKAMNSYMKAMGIENDGDIDYENYLKGWETYNYWRYCEDTDGGLKYWDTDNYSYSCNAGNYLKYIAGLDSGGYWLKDKNRSRRIRLDCNQYNCICFPNNDIDCIYASLFLKLPD